MTSVITYNNQRFLPDRTNEVFGVTDTLINAERAFKLKVLSEPATAASGYMNLFVNTSTSRLSLKDSSGTVHEVAVDASATEKGVVELATSSEVTTGTDTVRAVTCAALGPKGGASGFASLDGAALVPVTQLPAATTTVAGISELATVSEIATGTDTTRAVTCASLGPKGGISGFASLDGSALIPVAQLPAATDSAVGAVELATSSEVSTGTDTSRAVTCASLGPKGAANGFASLDAAGKVPNAQLPSSVTGSLSYQGTWNASTNTPTLVSSTGTQGHYYTVSVAGTTSIDSLTDWQPRDNIVFNGTAWEHIDNSDMSGVTSGSDLQFPSSSNPVLHVDDANYDAGLNNTTPTATLEIQPHSSQTSKSSFIAHTYDNTSTLTKVFEVESDNQINLCDRKITRVIKGASVAVGSTKQHVNYPDGQYIIDLEVFSQNDTASETWYMRALYRISVASSVGTLYKVTETGNVDEFTVSFNGTTQNNLDLDWQHGSGTTANYSIIYSITGLSDIVSPAFHQA